MTTYPLALHAAMDRGVTNPPERSFLHGETHWKCVAMMGLEIARWTPYVDYDLVFTFALLHDTMRMNDDVDPLHGPRAAQLLVALVDAGLLDGFIPYAQRTQDLLYAISSHNSAGNAREHDNTSIGVCWDADRLMLPRVGVTADPSDLTTEFVRNGMASSFGMALVDRHMRGWEFPSWMEIVRMYDEGRR